MRKSQFIENEKVKFVTGVIDRRSFISSAIAAGFTVPAALSLATSVEAHTPKNGGHIVSAQGHGSTTDSLDPATFENGFASNVGGSYSNCLTEVSNEGDLVGSLAESFETSDAKTWIFRLRKGVEFHNGKTLTPQDVIASLQHHMGEDSKSAAKGLLTSVKELSDDGDNNLKVVLETPNADFPYIVSDYHLIVLASEDGKVDVTKAIGTGAFVLDSYDPGVKASGTRFANYFGDGPYFDSFETLSILDATARQAALMSGEVDVIDRIPPKTVNLMAKNDNVRILEATGTLHYTFPMRLDVEPFGNYDLRMALKLALRRQELVDKILLGHGALGNDHPISTANRFHASELPQREFDPEKAAEHYKKSGHSGAIDLHVADAAFAGAVDAGQLIANSAKECGIEINVVREPSDGYWANVWNKKGWSACYWGGRPTEDWMFSAAYVKDTEWNDTAWRDTEAANRFNDIVVAARAEINNDVRRGMYAEAQTLIHNDGGTICPMFANYIMGLNKKVTHKDKIAANWELDGGNWIRRWWFA